MASTNDHLLEGEKANIKDELKTIFHEPDRWLDEPNDQLGGIKPKDLIGSPEKEKPLRDLLRAIKHGMPT
jgi:Antitoxin Xre/MbcA/ParS C-terminal toxin-binding domain